MQWDRELKSLDLLSDLLFSEAWSQAAQLMMAQTERIRENEQASCKLEHNNIFVYKKTNYHFLLKNISFWDFWTFHIEGGFLTPAFLCEMINCYTYVALLFFFTFFGGLRNIFGTFRWSKKWENDEFVEEVSETLIFILKKKQKNIVKIFKHRTKM